MDEVLACPFCRLPSSKHGIVYECDNWYIKLDTFPVNPGHLTIVCQRHIASIADLRDEEKVTLWPVLEFALNWLKRHYPNQGYNIGLNEGAAAGQTIMHLQLHIIPRYAGDADEPGGVRNVKPAMIKY